MKYSTYTHSFISAVFYYSHFAVRSLRGGVIQVVRELDRIWNRLRLDYPFSHTLAVSLNTICGPFCFTKGPGWHTHMHAFPLVYMDTRSSTHCATVCYYGDLHTHYIWHDLTHLWVRHCAVHTHTVCRVILCIMLPFAEQPSICACVSLSITAAAVTMETRVIDTGIYSWEGNQKQSKSPPHSLSLKKSRNQGSPSISYLIFICKWWSREPGCCLYHIQACRLIACWNWGSLGGNCGLE